MPIGLIKTLLRYNNLSQEDVYDEEVGGVDEHLRTLDSFKESKEHYNMVIIEISTKLMTDDKQWLLDLITRSPSEGGAGLNVTFITEFKKSHVFQVSAPVERLIETAERMRIIKRQENGVMREFCLEEIKLCKKIDELNSSFFSSREQQLLIKSCLDSVRYSPIIPPPPSDLFFRFHRDQAIIPSIETKGFIKVYPLHHPPSLAKLAKNWLNCFYLNQPLDDIYDYFGPGISFYFAFLGFYTSFLTVPAALGLIFYFLCIHLSSTLISFFCIFNVVWPTIFLVFWKRKSACLASNWGCFNNYQLKSEDPRPQFRGDKMGENPITKRAELICTGRSKYFKFYMVSLPIMIIFLLVCIILGVAYFMIDGWLNRLFMDNKKYYSFSSIGLTIVYGALIYLFDIFYRKVAVLLNNYENHKLQSSYDNFLIVKLVSFNFVNYFLALFYLAFYLQDYDLLSNNLTTLLITWQIIQQVQEALLPYIAYKYKKKKRLISLKKKEIKKEDEGQKMRKEEEGLEEERDEEELHIIGKDSTKISYDGTFDDYLELYLQFGYVFLFSAVLPTASLWALLNNWVELRTDAFKLCFIHRRSFSFSTHSPSSAGIGAWMPAFEFISIFSVINNVLLILNTPSTRSFFYQRGYDDLKIFVIFVAVEHSLLFIKAVISYLVPPVPGSVQKKEDRNEYLAKLALSEKRLEELKQDDLFSKKHN